MELNILAMGDVASEAGLTVAFAILPPEKAAPRRHENLIQNLRNYHAPVFVAPGNHDPPQDSLTLLCINQIRREIFMKKRLLSTVFALCAVALLSTAALAEAESIPTSGICGESITWNLVRDDPDDRWSDMTLTISGNGAMDNYNSYKSTPWSNYLFHIKTIVIESGITNIGNSAFNSCDNLISVTIPDSVSNIGSDAFSGCSALTSVTLPDSVNLIGSGAFSGCSALTSVTIPDSVTNIGNSTFSGCSALASVTIPNGVTSIGERAFSKCSSLTSVKIPNGVIALGDSSFSGSGLSSVTIPKSVIRGVESAFRTCSNLAEITVDANNAQYASQDGTLFDKDKLKLLLCPAGKTSFNISISVNEIAASAFAFCTKLTSVTIPNTVTTIGREAFYYCTSLQNIIIPNSVTSINSYTFSNCTSLTEISLSNGVREYPNIFGNNIFGNCPALEKVTVPEGVLSFHGTFSGCPNLSEISLPASLKSVYSNTFANCTKLKTITYSGTETQWAQIEIASGNQELGLATLICTGATPPVNPDKPETPVTPGALDLTVRNGGLGRRLTVQAESGHWLTIQTRRAGSISLTSIRVPGSGTASVQFSAAVGSVIQVWETTEEMTFQNGVPTNLILNTVVREL